MNKAFCLWMGIMLSAGVAWADYCDDVVNMVIEQLEQCAVMNDNFANTSCPPSSFSEAKPEWTKTNYGPALSCRWVGCNGNSDQVNGTNIVVPKECLPKMDTQPPFLQFRKPTRICGSVIQAENQILGETIPVEGAPFDLSSSTN